MSKSFAGPDYVLAGNELLIRKGVKTSPAAIFKENKLDGKIIGNNTQDMRLLQGIKVPCLVYTVEYIDLTEQQIAETAAVAKAAAEVDKMKKEIDDKAAAVAAAKAAGSAPPPLAKS